MRHRLLLVSLPLLAGCLSPDFVLDPDGDGVRWPYDCDNNDSEIPGVEVTGNGLDDDCDPTTPDSDLDGDGFDEGRDPIDCDDSDQGIFPGAPELCDGVDNDCDGAIDEGLDPQQAYVDSDGDGFGDGGQDPHYVCEGLAGYSTQEGDCDDGELTVYPGADEICGDGLIQDCLKSDGADVGCPFPKHMSPRDADHVILRENTSADCCSFDGVAPEGSAPAGIVVGMWGAVGGGAYRVDGWGNVDLTEPRLATVLADSYAPRMEEFDYSDFAKTVAVGGFVDDEGTTPDVVVGYNVERESSFDYVVSATVFDEGATHCKNGKQVGPFDEAVAITEMANVGKMSDAPYGENLAIARKSSKGIINVGILYDVDVVSFDKGCAFSVDSLEPYADYFQSTKVWALGDIGGSNNDDIAVSGHAGYHCYTNPFERFETVEETEVKRLSITRIDAPEGAPAPLPPVLYGVGQYRPPDLVDEIFDLACPDGYIVGAIYAGHDDDARLREHDVRIVSEHHMSIDSMAMIDSVLFISNDGGAGSIYQVEFDSTLIMADGMARIGGSNIFLADPWLTGHNSGDEFGAAMTTADLNHDGHKDLIVSAPGYDRYLPDLSISGLDAWEANPAGLEIVNGQREPGGAVYIFFADANGEFLQTSIDEADAIFYGHSGQQVGRHLIGLKDMNGDEIDDLLISVEPSASASPQTIAYILYGGPSTP